MSDNNSGKQQVESHLALSFTGKSVGLPVAMAYLGEFKTITSAIYSQDKTSAEWEKYIDVESMARFFIVQEVMDNPDGFHGSFYLHKDLKDGAKWTA